MIKYLIELLKLQNSIILPGFGSLMIGNSKTGKIVFNPLLKFNDGALAKHISAKEGIDLQDAQNQIAKFVREIEAELAKGNSFDMFELGNFTKNKEGVVEFIQDKMIIPDNTVEKKTTVVSEKKTEEKPKEVKKEENAGATQTKNSFNPDDKIEKKVDEKPVIDKNIPVAEASKKDPAAQEKNKFIPPVKDDKKVAATEIKKEGAKIVEVSDKDDKVVEKKEDGKKLSVKEKFKKDKPQKVKNQIPKEKKKKSGLVKWIVFLIIIGGGAAAAWFYQDEIKEFLYAGVDKDKDTTITQKPVIKDTLTIMEPDTLDIDIEPEIIEEPVKDNKKTKEKKVKEKPVNTSYTGEKGTFHIIGNAFSVKSNADNYVATMSSKGYSASVLGKFDGLYLVSLRSYSSREEANNGLSAVKSDASGAWVFKYK